MHSPASAGKTPALDKTVAVEQAVDHAAFYVRLTPAHVASMKVCAELGIEYLAGLQGAKSKESCAGSRIL